MILSQLVTPLPKRLLTWSLAQDGTAFAYGGDEVEVSLWDASRAFTTNAKTASADSTSTKRKRDDLLLGQATSL